MDDRPLRRHREVDLDLVDRRVELHGDRVADLERLRAAAAPRQVALEFEHHHDPAGIAAGPVVPHGRRGGEHSHDQAVAKRPLHHERRARPQRQQPAHPPGGRRVEAPLHSHEPLDPHRVEQRVPLAG
jgi:hypothetical protein